MSIDHANLINALESIINEAINKRIEEIRNDSFDINDHRYEIDDMIREYIDANVAVTLEVN